MHFKLKLVLVLHETQVSSNTGLKNMSKIRYTKFCFDLCSKSSLKRIATSFNIDINMIFILVEAKNLNWAISSIFTKKYSDEIMTVNRHKVKPGAYLLQVV